ncbi:MAG: hypothetical protein OEM38_09855, partial [Gammaproteobacteria bacterium]|nr:hypothetical protein [Gammaproteobacteria bacterium]
YYSVARLQSLFKKAGPHIQKKSPTYQMSYQLLQDYLDTILIEDHPTSLPEIKSRLSTLSDFCISCHTQDNKFRSLFIGTEGVLFESNLARADFNYATRNYREAHKDYEKHLLLTHNLKETDILNVLYRILSIYTQILNKPKEGIDALNQIESKKIFSDNIVKYIRNSKYALSELHAAKSNQEQNISFNDLNGYVTQYLGSNNLGQAIIFSSAAEKVERLWLRGALFRYLNNSPKENEMPYILYWLALCDISLGYGYDYTFADFYVKQCITRYPSHPFAKFCFSEYEKYVKFYFTTPAEPILPFEINNELKKLKSHLKIK